MNNSIIRIWRDSKRYWAGIVFILVLAAAAGALKTLSALYWGFAVDAGIMGYINLMTIYAVIMLLFIAADGLRTALLYAVAGRVSEGMIKDIRMRMFAALAMADMGRLERDMRSGDIAVRANNNATALSDLVAADFTHYSRIIFQALIAVVACLILSWQLSVVFMLALPITTFTLKLVMRPIAAMEKETRQNVGRFANIGLDAISGIHAVKTYQLEGFMSRRFDNIVDENYKHHVKLAKVGMWTTSVKYIAHVIQIMALFLMGAWLTSEGIVTVGTVLAFVAISANITESISSIDQVIARAARARVLADRMYDILDLPQEQSGDNSKLIETKTPIVFENVNFSYDGSELVLKNISLQVHEGQKVAIVGASGSGKSTIAKLISRLYSHSEGSIKIFGVEANELELNALRSELAIVTQESNLFEGSILDNVRLGNPDASAEAAAAALQAAGLWAYVQTLPEGMDTPLNEFGANLSGGQRQRLCIARALVRDAKLVLLDEPTSALDNQTEQALQQALDSLLTNRTAVIIAHRISTIQNADYVYCIDNGAVMEEGSPQDLLKKQGYYHAMCKLQGLI